MTAASTRLRRLLGKPRSWAHRGHHWRTRLLTQLDCTPRRVAGWSAVTAACVAALAGGPVAAVVTAVYTALAVLAFTRHRAATATRRHRTASRQAIATLAADLRAGTDATAALAEARLHLAPMRESRFPSHAHQLGQDDVGGDAGRQGHLRTAARSPKDRSRPPSTHTQALADARDPVCRRVRDRLDAITRIAETAGAPVSSLLDRLAADLRATARVEATLSTHTAGIGASSLLLAALPMAGLALGQALGTDPVAILLHTPMGAGCVAVAMILQLAGLAWSRRILAAATGASS